MKLLKKRPGYDSRVKSLAQLPILSPELATRSIPPHGLSLAAIHLASLLGKENEESSDRKNGEGCRYLLSRALERGDLDQFLTTFFNHPADILFAREKVTQVLFTNMSQVFVGWDELHLSQISFNISNPDSTHFFHVIE